MSRREPGHSHILVGPHDRSVPSLWPFQLYGGTSEARAPPLRRCGGWRRDIRRGRVCCANRRVVTPPEPSRGGSAHDADGECGVLGEGATAVARQLTTSCAFVDLLSTAGDP